jgi:hypothetical protein
LTHTPENCFSREEYKQEGKRWVENMQESANRIGVKVEGAYVAPNEHTFYFILECQGLREVSEFLGPPLIQLNSGKASPVISVEEAFGLSFVRKSAAETE